MHYCVTSVVHLLWHSHLQNYCLSSALQHSHTSVTEHFTVLILCDWVSSSSAFSLSMAFEILQTSVTSLLILSSSVNGHRGFSLFSKGSCLCCGLQYPLLHYFHWENQTSEKNNLGTMKWATSKEDYVLRPQREKVLEIHTGRAKFLFFPVQIFKNIQPSSPHEGHLTVKL